MFTTAIIGAGNMGSALYQGIRQTTNIDIHLCDRNASKLSIAPAHSRFLDVLEGTQEMDCVVIAVKPQSFRKLMDEVKDMWSKKFIVSIMAGVSLAQLETLTGSSRIVRAMPNLGARICQSVTGWCAGSTISASEREHVAILFKSIGLDIELKDEEHIDLFTAIAGSGPAYVFGLAELFENAAQRLGLSGNESANIATAVIAASSRLLEEKTMSASEWRKAVTSKGGVTEAALDIFSKRKLPMIFNEALDAGALRSRALSSDNE